MDLQTKEDNVVARYFCGKVLKHLLFSRARRSQQNKQLETDAAADASSPYKLEG